MAFENDDRFQIIFAQFIQETGRDSSVSEQWGISKIRAIWKRKGSPTDTKKYRGISIGFILTKVAMNIILQRWSSFYTVQLLETQCGFRSERGCNDGIYVMRQLEYITNQSNRKLYTCYVDLSAAYDHTNRNFLFKSIKNRFPRGGANTKNVDILEKLYSATKSYLTDEDPETPKSDTYAGVRQGGTESPVLFNLYLDYALRVWKYRCEQNGLKNLDVPYNIPNEATNRKQRQFAQQNGMYKDSEGGYANDIGIHSWDKDELQLRATMLYDVFCEFGLEMNIEKTETRIWNWNTEEEGDYPKSIITINKIPLNNTRTFKYLGYKYKYIGQEEV